MFVLYCVKKGNKYMYKYQNKRAQWITAFDGCWMTHDKEIAKGFAQMTKGKAIEITLTEKELG